MKQLLQNIDSRELAEWAAYNSLEPIGGKRGDLHAGIIASTIANVNRGKGSKTFSPTDFMLVDRDEKEEQSEDDMKALFLPFIKDSNNGNSEEA
mgnify:CR=1 FL=1